MLCINLRLDSFQNADADTNLFTYGILPLTFLRMSAAKEIAAPYIFCLLFLAKSGIRYENCDLIHRNYKLQHIRCLKESQVLGIHTVHPTNRIYRDLGQNSRNQKSNARSNFYFPGLFIATTITTSVFCFPSPLPNFALLAQGSGDEGMCVIMECMQFNESDCVNFSAPLYTSL